jgi:hypothetical protein
VAESSSEECSHFWTTSGNKQSVLGGVEAVETGTERLAEWRQPGDDTAFRVAADGRC